MKHIRIDSNFEVFPQEFPIFTADQIRREPQLFQCDLATAEQRGGIITKEVIHKLPASWKDFKGVLIDSRVHMLMPGWYPCIPGWHHDDVPRTRSDGQPNYDDFQVRAEHLLFLANGNICPTEFAVGEAVFEEPAVGNTIYEEWHPQVELMLKNGIMERREVPTNKLVRFDDRSWHRGTPAKVGGWRFFIRFSRFRNPEGLACVPPRKAMNELRTQTQVYMSAVNAGW